MKLGRSVLRRLDLCGTPVNLDFCDDTDNSLNDFVFGTPSPRNNAGTTGTIPLSTCGNGILEGLEECDDANGNPGDGCFNCRLEPPPCANVIGDMNKDNVYTGSDVVLMLNCAFLGSGVCDPCFADVNKDGILTGSDVVLEANRAFLGAATFLWCGL